MPPEKDMGTEGDPQTHLFQWGDTKMEDWRRHGYDTSNNAYNGGYPMDRKLFLRSREKTAWSTTNETYGKGLMRAHSDKAGSDSHSQLSYRSYPGLRRGDCVELTGSGKPTARGALEERLFRGGRPTMEKETPGFLPPLDKSKYLVAQGPTFPIWQKPEPEVKSRGEVSEVAPPLSTSSPPQPPPKTGPAKRYMRDTLDRFLRSIPEELRPKTRKQTMQPREAPQVLTINHPDIAHRKSVLPERDAVGTAVSHAVPTPPSSAGSMTSSSSSGSSDGVVDLNQSTYDLRKELEGK